MFLLKLLLYKNILKADIRKKKINTVFLNTRLKRYKLKILQQERNVMVCVRAHTHRVRDRDIEKKLQGENDIFYF